MTLAEKEARLREEIDRVCRSCGRKAEDVRLMAVSKFQPQSAVISAYAAGLRLFGESRVQEAAQKFSERQTEFPASQLHMIGALQRNKAKAASRLFDCVQSVDRLSLITALGECAAAREAPLDIFFELNAGEESKSGFLHADELFAATEAALAFPSLRIRGLMTMAPFINDEKAIRAAFRALRNAQAALRGHFDGQADFAELSMGMSGDFKIAIEEGATLIRIGTALFGERAG